MACWGGGGGGGQDGVHVFPEPGSIAWGVREVRRRRAGGRARETRRPRSGEEKDGLGGRGCVCVGGGVERGRGLEVSSHL